MGAATRQRPPHHSHKIMPALNKAEAAKVTEAPYVPLTGHVFHDYRKERPPAAGWYVWRLPHKFLEGVTLIFLAEYRLRGAGFESVLSPSFDYWDGYRVLLPKGSIEWAEYSGEKPKPLRELLEVVGVKNLPCPFCKTRPTWVYSGRYICAPPTDAEYYYLECCHWFDGFRSRMADPVKLAAMRNEALSPLLT
jgi:hypothetical protein